MIAMTPARALPRIARTVGSAALTLALVLASVQLEAQEPPSDSADLYDVEIVVFRNLDARAPDSPELANLPTGNPLLTESTDPMQDEPPPIAGAVATPSFEVNELPAAQQSLGAIEGSLRRSAGYRPLAHIGWTQPAQFRGGAEPVVLDAWLAGTSLSGTVRLSAGRFLHLALSLDYVTDDGTLLTIAETRRMRSGERHYFDHPYFGVIAIVTRRAETG
jgi:hypothetical protein